MNALENIRRNVFGMTQQDFAALVGVPQSRISRWENAESSPSLEEIGRIRDAAKGRKLKRAWNDKLLFGDTQSASAA